jgi:hypothetical protein
MAFLLLAIAGLAYLLPGRILKRIDDLLWVRLILIVFFFTFGIAAIIINAVNREEEEHAKGELQTTISKQGEKLDWLNDSNGRILNYFVSGKNMSESERRENIEKSLRNEYIISHDLIDPEILAGNKMPPDDWMNKRLTQLGEKWQVARSNTGNSVNPQPLISIGSITPRLPNKAGDEAAADVQILVNGRSSQTVNMGQLTAVYPVSADPNVQRATENELWNTLLDHDKKLGFVSLALPVNNKALAMPLKQRNITQGELDLVNSGANGYYFMSHVEDLRGKTLLDVCFYVNSKSQTTFCREHNGP